jgi:hypothetical protein
MNVGIIYALLYRRSPFSVLVNNNQLPLFRILWLFKSLKYMGAIRSRVFFFGRFSSLVDQKIPMPLIQGFFGQKKH